MVPFVLPQLLLIGPLLYLSLLLPVALNLAYVRSVGGSANLLTRAAGADLALLLALGSG